MIEIDYTITYQDDLDSLQTHSEYSFGRTWVKWFLIRGGTAFYLLFGLFCIIDGLIEKNDPDAVLVIRIGVFFIVIGCIYPLIFNPKLAQSRLNRRAMKKSWDKKPSHREYRCITFTETEFIFKTDFLKLACNWTAFKKYFAGEKGYQLWFYSEDCIYIPRRIFSTKEEKEKFETFLNKYQQMT